jgi:hypothetical protein
MAAHAATNAMLPPRPAATVAKKTPAPTTMVGAHGGDSNGGAQTINNLLKAQKWQR